jgi:hypothetical protein
MRLLLKMALIGICAVGFTLAIPFVIFATAVYALGEGLKTMFQTFFVTSHDVVCELADFYRPSELRKHYWDRWWIIPKRANS